MFFWYLMTFYKHMIAFCAWCFLWFLLFFNLVSGALSFVSSKSFYYIVLWNSGRNPNLAMQIHTLTLYCSSTNTVKCSPGDVPFWGYTKYEAKLPMPFLIIPNGVAALPSIWELNWHTVFWTCFWFDIHQHSKHGCLPDINGWMVTSASQKHK